MTIRDLIDELRQVAERENALDAPVWFECGSWVAGDHEITVSRPVYTTGPRTEVRFTVNGQHEDEES